MVFACLRPKDILDDEPRMNTSSAQASMSSQKKLLRKQARFEASRQKALEVDRLAQSASRNSKVPAGNRVISGEGASAERKKSHQSRSTSCSQTSLSLQANQTTGGSTDLRLLKTIRSLPPASQPSIVSAYHLDRPKSSDDFRREIAEALARGKLALARVQSLLDQPAYSSIREQYDESSVTQASCRKVEAWMEAINSAMASPQKEKIPGGEWLNQADRGIEEVRLQEGWAPPIVMEKGWERGGYPIFHVDWAKLEGEVKQARETRWQELDEQRELAQSPPRIITADELKLDVQLAPIRTRSNSSTSSTVRSASSGSNGSSNPSCTSDREASSEHKKAPLLSLKSDRRSSPELPISSAVASKQSPEKSSASLKFDAVASRLKEVSPVAANEEVTSEQAHLALPVETSPTEIVKSLSSSQVDQEVVSQPLEAEFDGRDPLPSIDEFLRRQAAKGSRKTSTANEGLCLPYVARTQRAQYDQRRRTLESFLQTSGLRAAERESESETPAVRLPETEDIYAKFSAKRAAFEGLKSPDSILFREPSPASSGATSDGHESIWGAELKANWQSRRKEGLARV